MNFEALIAAEQPGLTRRLARSLGGDVSTAEDLCQEVLVRAWRKLPREQNRPPSARGSDAPHPM